MVTHPGTQARELQETFVGRPLDVYKVREPVANLCIEVHIGSLYQVSFTTQIER